MNIQMTQSVTAPYQPILPGVIRLKVNQKLPSIPLLIFSAILIIMFADISGDYPYLFGTELRRLMPGLSQYTHLISTVLIAVIALMGIIRFFKRKGVFGVGLDIELFLVFFMASTLFGVLVGLIQGVNPSYIIGDSQNIVVYLALFAINDTNTDRGLRYLRILFFVSCGIIIVKLASCLISGLLIGSPLSWRYLFKGSPFLSPMMLLALSIFTGTRSSAEKFKWMLIFIISSIGMFTAMSRGIFLGSFAGLLSIFMLLRFNRKFIKILFACILMAITFMYLASTMQGNINMMVGRWGVKDYQGGFEYRTRQASMLMGSFAKNPLTGNGLGWANSEYEGYRDWHDRPYLFELEPLNLLAKLGVIGFGMLVVAYMFLFRGCIRISKRATSLEHRCLIAGLTAGLISLLVQSGVQTMYSSVMFHLYVVIVLLVLSGIRAVERRKQNLTLSARGNYGH